MRKWWRFLSPIFILIVWSILTYKGFVDYAIIPYPHKVLIEFWRYLTTGEALKDLLPTTKCLFCGLAVGVGIGVFVGVVLGYFTKLHESLEFAIDFFRGIPSSALFPIFMLMLGLGDSSRIAFVAYGTTFIMLINTLYGVKNSKKIRVLVAKTMNASRLEILIKVIFPDALPYIAAGLRIAASIALVIAIVSEMFIGTNAGLGYRIMESRVMYNIPNVFSALILTGILGYTVNKLFLLIEKRVIHWSGE